MKAETLAMLKKVSRDSKRYFETIAKGITLALWLFLLGFGALLAINGRASEIILNYFKGWDGGALHDTKTPQTPSGLLKAFQARMDNPPPIAALLEACLQKWTVKTESRSDEDYTTLFRRTSDRLRACVDDPQFDTTSSKISTDFVSSAFRDPGLPSDIPLTLELKTWIANQKDLAKTNASRTSLVDTFVLLIIIGAFGSLIFLTRDYMIEIASI